MKTQSILSAWCLVSLAATINAATFTVSNPQDSGAGSLRQAIIDANNSPGTDTIDFSVTGKITLSNALPAVSGNTLIQGPGTNTLSIDGANAFRLFAFSAGTTNEVSGLTLVNGFVGTNQQGGAILNSGSLTVSDCVLSNNTVVGGQGGALYNLGQLTVTGSLFISNSVIGPSASNAWGGAVYCDSGVALFSNSTFFGNAAVGWSSDGVSGGAAGGGALLVNSGSCQVWDSGFILNKASGGPGGGAAEGGAVLLVSGSVAMNRCLSVSNTSTGGGGWSFGGLNGYFGGDAGNARGGFLSVSDGAATLISCAILTNTVRGGDGGAGIRFPGAGGSAQGGGIAHRGSQLGLTNCTFSANYARGGDTSYGTMKFAVPGSPQGGGLYCEGSASIGNCTLAANLGHPGLRFEQSGPQLYFQDLATAYGGGAFLGSNIVSMVNCLLSSNTILVPGYVTNFPFGDVHETAVFKFSDAFGQPLSSSNNLFSTSSNLTGLSPSDIVNPVTKLQPLRNDGGRTPTHSISIASPAYNAGTATGAPVNDQRGIIRPQAGAPDIGAFEVQTVTVLVDNQIAIQGDAAGRIGSAVVAFETVFTNGTLLYTLDGSTPFFGSTLYTGSFTVTNSATLRAIAYNSDFSQSALSDTVQLGITPLYSLTVVTNGLGTVGVSPSQASFPSNSVVSATPTPGVGYYFAGWSGAATGTDSPLLVVMNSNKTIQADFALLATYTLAVITNGSGTITVAPTNSPYPSNTLVSLTATPASGWFFKQWSGDVSGTNTSTNVVMNANKSVTGTFIPGYALTALPALGGTTLVSPVTSLYPSGSVVSASAIGSNGWQFLYWRGDAPSQTSNLNVVMDSAKVLQPVFGTTLSLTPSGNGTISPSPSFSLYPYGSTVRLTATPNLGSYFALWGNAASGTSNPFSFKITNATPAVSALFVLLGTNQVALTATASGKGAVTVSPSGNVFTTGQAVTITAMPDVDQQFIGWSGDATGTNNPLGLTLDTSKNVVAQFTDRPVLNISPPLGGLTASGFRFTLEGIPSVIYDIFASETLTNWSKIFSITNGVFGQAQIVDPLATNQWRFYRATQSAP